MTRRPRQTDIARFAGVSQSTVSLVINGRAAELNIAPETQQRVLDAVGELGYAIDPVARRLAGGGTRLLGVFTFEPVFPRESKDFYYPFMVGIEEEAERLGYDLVLFTGGAGTEVRRSIYRDGVNRLGLADGAVLLGMTLDRSELISLRAERFQFVHIGRRETDESDIPFVAADYAGATERVVERLAGLGHRSIGYLAPVVEDEPTTDREQGFHRAARRLGLDTGLVVRHPDDGPTTADVIGLRNRGVTAFVTHYVDHALAIRELLEHRGIRVPRDCSLVALDEVPAGSRLAGFAMPRRAMGVHAVRVLVQQIESDSDHVPQTFLPCHLVEGDSCTAAPAATANRRRKAS